MSNTCDKYEVIVSKRATQMLVSHSAFLARVNLEAAENLLCSFEIAVRSLEIMPYRCPRFSSDYITANKYRYLIFDKRYLIIYQVIDNKVYVDYIVDSHQDYNWLIH